MISFVPRAQHILTEPEPRPGLSLLQKEPTDQTWKDSGFNQQLQHGEGSENKQNSRRLSPASRFHTKHGQSPGPTHLDFLNCSNMPPAPPQWGLAGLMWEDDSSWLLLQPLV